MKRLPGPPGECCSPSAASNTVSPSTVRANIAATDVPLLINLILWCGRGRGTRWSYSWHGRHVIWFAPWRSVAASSLHCFTARCGECRAAAAIWRRRRRPGGAVVVLAIRSESFLACSCVQDVLAMHELIVAGKVLVDANAILLRSIVDDVRLHPTRIMSFRARVRSNRGAAAAALCASMAQLSASPSLP